MASRTTTPRASANPVEQNHRRSSIGFADVVDGKARHVADTAAGVVESSDYSLPLPMTQPPSETDDTCNSEKPAHDPAPQPASTCPGTAAVISGRISMTLAS